MKRSRSVALGATFVALAASLAACSAEEVGYCGDEYGTVLPEDQCDGDDGGTFIYVGTYAHHVPGERLDTGRASARVPSNDPQARTGVGLPARGGFGGNGAAISSGG